MTARSDATTRAITTRGRPLMRVSVPSRLGIPGNRGHPSAVPEPHDRRSEAMGDLRQMVTTAAVCVLVLAGYTATHGSTARAVSGPGVPTSGALQPFLR